MAERHLFDLIDLELCKDSPMSWGDRDWEIMGMCEGKLRRGNGHLVYTLMHGFVMRARKAFVREGRESPWDDNYARKVFVIPGEPEPVEPKNNRDFILTALANVATSGGVRRKDILLEVAKLTSAPHSTLNVLIDKMEEEGWLRRIGHGVYDLTPQSKKLPVVKAAIAAHGARA